jgi:hypothetical protein
MPRFFHRNPLCQQARSALHAILKNAPLQTLGETGFPARKKAFSAANSERRVKNAPLQTLGETGFPAKKDVFYLE